MPTLDGRTAVVTGAAQGIGLATAVALAECGAAVALLDVRDDELRTAAETVGEGGGRVVTSSVDVADRAQVEAAFAGLPFDTIDVLVNNAGIREVTSFQDLELDDWDRIVAIDLSGAFYCCKAAYPRLRRPGSSIVNVSSVAGLVGVPKRVAYSAAKHGLVGLTRGLADDLGPEGIRVNVVCPGVTETPLTESYFDNSVLTAELRKVTPLRRWATPTEIAAVIAFLASTEASFCTGAVFAADGGYTATKGFG